MGKSLDELKKKLADEEKALRAKYAEKLAIAKKKDQRVQNLEKQKFRAQENHAKYLLAGYILAEVKKSKNVDILKNCLATLTKPKDKADMQALMQALIKSIS